MVATKRCAWGTCKNDTRYPERMQKNKRDDKQEYPTVPTHIQNQTIPFSAFLPGLGRG